MSKIAITCGDPAGVGPEIVRRWAQECRSDAADCCFIGWAGWMRGQRLKEVVVAKDFEPVPGQPTEEGARIALKAMEEAAAGCREGRYRAVVTCPVSKEWLARIGYPFPGQTEFFAERWGGQPSMAFAGGCLKVVLATWHIPLMQVREALTAEALELAVNQAAVLARAWGAQEPRIAVCGLNPHAGENGILGTEERDFINPLLERLRPRFPGLSTALPADTVFYRAMQNEFDVVVALYHDQGLAPLKLIDFHSSVNITLGLPHIRTSPDHGTGFSIAGHDMADTGSFANAVKAAKRLTNIQ